MGNESCRLGDRDLRLATCSPARIGTFARTDSQTYENANRSLTAVTLNKARRAGRRDKLRPDSGFGNKRVRRSKFMSELLYVRA